MRWHQPARTAIPHAMQARASAAHNRVAPVQKQGANKDTGQGESATATNTNRNARDRSLRVQTRTLSVYETLGDLMCVCVCVGGEGMAGSVFRECIRDMHAGRFAWAWPCQSQRRCIYAWAFIRTGRRFKHTADASIQGAHPLTQRITTQMHLCRGDTAK